MGKCFSYYRLNMLTADTAGLLQQMKTVIVFFTNNN